MKTLLSIAAMAFALSSAQACPLQRSVEAEQLDKTVVASVAIPQSEPVATAASQETPKVEPTAE